ncbi:MAG: DUF4124 domain-containing protein [Deltaproteobacteria bacterium]|nr:DUF4124 domain-containing protein [Deltaproteobacteria bacterium]
MIKIRLKYFFICFIIMLWSVLCFSSVGHSEIYKWTDENGTVHYSNVPPADQEVETLQERPINKADGSPPASQSETSSSNDSYSAYDIKNQIRSVEAKIKKCETEIVDCESDIEKYKQKIEELKKKQWDLPSHYKSHEEGEYYYRLKKGYEESIERYESYIKDRKQQIKENKLALMDLEDELKKLQRQETAITAEKKSSQAIVYHGNIKTHVFHQPGCQHYHCKDCIVKFSSREAAIRAGYRPCEICNP